MTDVATTTPVEPEAPPVKVVIPHTGELIPDVTALTSRDVAARIDEIKALVESAQAAKRSLDAEILRRLDKRRDWTLREGEFEISAPSDALVLSVDIDGFRAALQTLVGEGVIAVEAALAAIKRKPVEFSAPAKGVRALLKNPEIAARLGDVVREVKNEKRYVTVKRHEVTLP